MGVVKRGQFWWLQRIARSRRVQSVVLQELLHLRGVLSESLLQPSHDVPQASLVLGSQQPDLVVAGRERDRERERLSAVASMRRRRERDFLPRTVRENRPVFARHRRDRKMFSASPLSSPVATKQSCSTSKMLDKSVLLSSTCEVGGDWRRQLRILSVSIYESTRSRSP